MAAKKLRIRIRASTTVRFDQIKEMTQEEWDKFKSSTPQQNGDWIDVADIDDADDFDGTNFDVEVVDKNGKQVLPRDYYTL